MAEKNSPELEEGEASWYREKEDANNNIDPDIAFSYLDEKIQNLLGHFQKDFEGKASAENLGAKFREYGSFLPTYKWSSFPRQRSPPRSCVTLKTPNSVPAENVQAPATVPPSSKLQNASCSMESLGNAKLISGDVIHIKQESSLSTNSVVGCPVPNGATKGEYKTNQGSLKFRFKLPDINTKKNMALYDGLGLVGSPSTSSGSSSEENEGQPSLSGGASNLSFADILQVMTSFPVPAGEIISPLHESLLSLLKKEPLAKDSRPSNYVKASLASDMAPNQSVDVKAGTAKLSKQKKLKSVSQHKRLTEVQYENGTNLHNKMSSPAKKKIKNELLEAEESQPSDLGKATVYDTGGCDESLKAVASPSNVSMGVCREKGRSRAVSDVVKESNPGCDDGIRTQNGRKSLTVRPGEIRSPSFDVDPLFDFNDKLRVKKSSVLSQDSKQLLKCEGDFSITEEDPLRRKFNQFHGQNREEKKHVTGGKKVKGTVFDTKEAVCPTKVRLTGTRELVAKDMKVSSLDANPSRNNVCKKSEKESTIHMYEHKDAHASSSSELKCPEVPSRGRRKSLSFNNGDARNDVATDSSKERNTFILRPAREDVPKKVMSESTLVVAPPDTDNWVCCDNCNQWRILPLGMTDNDLPEKWLCSMLDWLPEKITCATSEEKTNTATKALSTSQFQSHASASNYGVTSSDIQYLSQSPHSFSNHARNNKLSSKDHVGSGKGKFLSLDKNNKKTSLQDPSKSRSVNNMIPQLPTESHSWKKTESADPGKDLKHISKRKERTSSEGEDKLSKVKVKWESNEYGAEIFKGVKMHEDTSGLSAQRKVKISSKYKGAEVHPPKEQKTSGMDRLVFSLKNLGGRAPVQAPTGYASQDLNKSNKGSSLSKKRKFKDFQEIIPDCSGERSSRKEKKSRELDITRNEISQKDGNDRTNEEVSTLRNFSSGFVNAPTNVLDGISSAKDRRKKHLKVLGTKQSLDHIELMRGDTGDGQILLATTSSSSKVSSSHKTTVNYEVKGSPVESVSSSPLRVKRTDAGSRLPCHSDTKTGIAPVMGNASKVSSKKINGVSKLSRVVSEEKLSSDFRQESLKCDTEQRNSKTLAQSVNGHFVIGRAGIVGNGKLSVDTCVDHSAGESRARMKNKVSALLPVQSGDVSKQQPTDGDDYPKLDFDTLGEKALETTMEKRFESEVKSEDAAERTYKVTFTYDADKNDKKRCGQRESLVRSVNDGKIDKLAKEYNCLQDSSLNKLRHDSEGQTRVASVSGDSITGKSILALNPQDVVKQGIPSRGSSRAVPRVSTCRMNQVDVSANGNVSKEVKMNKNGALNSSDCFVLDRHDYKDVIASSPAKLNLSHQTANDVMKKAKDLRDHADRLKNAGFTSESSGACFQAALKFLLGASLLENCGGESGQQTTPLQVYSVTAKLFQSCATEFEGHEEMSAASLAYKCMEVAFMRVGFCKQASLSRDWNELRAVLLQGESPSSSSSDVDNLNNQAMADRPSLPKGAAPQIVGSNIIVDQNRHCVARLLDFTQDVALAMEASGKCHICFTKAIAGMKKSKNGDHMTSLQTVIDFSYQDIERLIPLVQLAWEAIGCSGLRASKE